MITCVQIAVIGRETSVELGRSLVASARDVPLMTSVDGTLMTRQVGSKDHRRSTHYESAPDRTTQVNARIDLGLAVCWWWLLAVNGCLRASQGHLDRVAVTFAVKAACYFRPKWEQAACAWRSSARRSW